MPSTRKALLVATDQYLDRTFSALTAPQADAAALAAVLADSEIGGYTVETLINRPSYDVRRYANKLFTEAKRDDLILFYVSGHGVKDETGRLYFATADTERQLLASTGVSADFIRDLVDNSQARRIAVWLDCCYAGAFPAGRMARAEGQVDVLAQLNSGPGRGCAVMAASTAIQYAFETGSEARLRGVAQPSVFTGVLVEGLRTGAADLDSDGLIDAAELYTYVSERVREVSSEQTPTRNDQVTGEFYIARSRRGIAWDASLSAEIRRALLSGFLQIRLGAIHELAGLARSGSDAARQVLGRLLLHEDADMAWASSQALYDQPEPEGARAEPPEHEGPRAGFQPSPAELGSTRTEPSEREGGHPELVEPEGAGAAKDPTSNPGVPVEAGSQTTRPLTPATLTPPRGLRRSVPWRPRARIMAGWLMMPVFGAGAWLLVARPLSLVSLVIVIVAMASTVFLIRPAIRLQRAIRNDSSTILVRSSIRVGSATFSADGTLVAFLEYGVHVWQTATWSAVHSFHGGGLVRKVSFGMSDSRLAWAGGDDLVHLIDTQHWGAQEPVELAAAGVRVVTFAPAGDILVSGADSHVQVWHAGDWRPIATLSCRGVVRCLSFSRSGLQLVVVTAETVSTWDTETWTELQQYRSEYTTFHCAAFSADGRHLFGGSRNGRIYVWNTADGTVQRQTKAHRRVITTIALSPSGDSFATASWDGTIGIWSSDRAEPISRLTGHYSWVRSVAYSPDSRFLLSGSRDGTLRLWPVAGAPSPPR